MTGDRPAFPDSPESPANPGQSTCANRAKSARRGRYADTARIVELEAEVDVLRKTLDDARTQIDRHSLLMAEMYHRVRNTFAVVQAMVHSTRRHSATGADFQVAFDERLLVMARSHDMLMRTEWSPAELREVIQNALEAFQTEPGRFTLEGPPLLLAANHVVSMSLTFHELATNAVKHGSLSAPGGRVSVTWEIVAVIGGLPRIEVVWVERGGPRVERPTRRGFGSQLMTIGMPAEGRVRLSFPQDGLECRISLPCDAHTKHL